MTLRALLPVKGACHPIPPQGTHDRAAFPPVPALWPGAARRFGRARAAHPDLVIEQILEQTNPSSALLRAARGASLLVMGTHHRGLVKGALLGSIGQDVLAQSRIPVCVVPGDRSS